MELFNRVLPVVKIQQDNSACQQLAKFIRYCIKQYVKHAQSNPLFLVESLFKGVRQSAIEANAKGEKDDDDDEPVTRLRDHEDSDDDGEAGDEVTVSLIGLLQLLRNSSSLICEMHRAIPLPSNWKSNLDSHGVSK